VAFLDTVGSLTAVGKLVEAILLEESFDWDGINFPANGNT
jgi:hypothetical protein